MYSTIQKERERATEGAIKIALEYFEEFDFDYHTHIYETRCKDINTVSIFVKNKNSSVGCLIGNGKGIGNQSFASGLFETLEHYLGDPIFYGRQTKKSTIMSIVEKEKLLLEEYPIKHLFKLDKLLEIEVLQYYSVLNENEILYPAFLTHPNYITDHNTSYSNLYKYSTASGTAVGTSKEEALIHAINEVIERDALSLHYIKSFLSKKEHKIIEIEKNSLPKQLREITNLLEETLRSNIRILDISTEFGVYTYLVFSKHNDFLIPFQGSGSSIFPHYALERALLECLQSFQLYDKDLEIEDKYTIIELQKFEKFKNIALLNYENEVLFQPFYYSNIEYNNLTSILSTIIHNITQRGRNIYYTPIYSDDNIYCTHVIIPGLEKFNLIKYGFLVLPNNRGNYWVGE